MQLCTYVSHVDISSEASQPLFKPSQAKESEHVPVPGLASAGALASQRVTRGSMMHVALVHRRVSLLVRVRKLGRLRAAVHVNPTIPVPYSELSIFIHSTSPFRIAIGFERSFACNRVRLTSTPRLSGESNENHKVVVSWTCFTHDHPIDASRGHGGEREYVSVKPIANELQLQKKEITHMHARPSEECFHLHSIFSRQRIFHDHPLSIA